jgi:hypothetical protein
LMAFPRFTPGFAGASALGWLFARFIMGSRFI